MAAGWPLLPWLLRSRRLFRLGTFFRLLAMTAAIFAVFTVLETAAAAATATPSAPPARAFPLLFTVILARRAHSSRAACRYFPGRISVGWRHHVRGFEGSFEPFPKHLGGAGLPRFRPA